VLPQPEERSRSVAVLREGESQSEPDDAIPTYEKRLSAAQKKRAGTRPALGFCK